MSSNTCSTLITKEFLEQLLGQEIDSFTVEIGTKPGDNYLSTIYKVQAVFFQVDSSVSTKIVKHILVKCYPENQAKQEFLDNASLFRTEYMIYSEFLPALNKLARDGLMNGDTSFEVNTAEFYGGNIVGLKSIFQSEAWNKENFLVMEDLRVKGYKMLDRRVGLDLEHCLLTVEQLASLHALSWVYKKRENLECLVSKYPYLQDALYKKENEAGWRPIVEGFNRSALQVIEEEFGVDSDIFLKLKFLFSQDVMGIIRMFLSVQGVDEGWAEELLRIKPKDAIPDFTEPWVVATHGDAWICNLLFSYPDSNTEKPNCVALVDHQAFREACLTTDLAYFIYSSTRPTLRKQSLDVVLRAYYNKFVKICASLNQTLPVGFTYENFKRRWRRTRLYALLMSIQFLTFVYKPRVPETPTRSPDLSSSRNTATDVGEIQDAYADVLNASQNNTEWREAVIATILAEYEDGIF